MGSCRLTQKDSISCGEPGQNHLQKGTDITSTQPTLQSFGVAEVLLVPGSLDLTAMALAEDSELSNFTGVVQDSGEGRWTIQAAIEEAVSAEVLTAALFARFRSRQEHTFAEKMLSAMRNKFGGHVEIYPGN